MNPRNSRGQLGISDDEFRKTFEACRGSIAATATALGMTQRSAHRKRRLIEARTGSPLLSLSVNSPDRALIPENENTYIRRNQAACLNGRVVVFTDAHIYPGSVSVARRGLMKLLPLIKPSIVIDNGDSFDGGQISRHERIGWDKRPTVKEELEANIAFHAEVEGLAPGAMFFWNWGNHDLRFPTRLASRVPEFEGIKGFRLEDHFPRWKFGISVTINPEVYTPTMVKHRYRSGDHADWNNVMRSGINTFTGHDHQLTVRPFVNKRGVQYGGRAGTLADPDLPIFDYQENNPSQARSGFVVLPFHDGKLLWPQVCAALDENHVEFRGEAVRV